MGQCILSKETTRWQGLGAEPPTFRSEVQSANHYTTAPPMNAGGGRGEVGCQATIILPSCRVVMFLFLGQDLYSTSFLSIQMYKRGPTKHAVLDPQLIQKVAGRGAVIFLDASCCRKLS